MKPSQILKRAQKLIDAPEKWCKGVYINSRGAHCAVGALRDSYVTEYGMECRAAYLYLDETMTGKFDTVYDANDLRHTKHIHVMMAFDFAILMAKDDERGAR